MKHQHAGWKSRNGGEKSGSEQGQKHEGLVPFGALGRAGVSWGHRAQKVLENPQERAKEGGRPQRSFF